MIPDSEFDKLLAELIRIGESFKGAPAGKDNRYIDAEGLLLKFILHCTTINHLIMGVPSPVNSKIAILDPGSINVLARATLETFLTFQYIFVLPKDGDEKDLSYWIWLRSGILERLIPEPILDEHRKLLPKIQKDADDLRIEIANNPCYLKMPQKWQEKLLKKGYWRLPIMRQNGSWNQPSWVDIMILTGFDKAIATIMYSYLSCYTHSNNLSVNQIYEAQQHVQRQALIGTPTDITKMLMQMMIDSYRDAFKQN